MKIGIDLGGSHIGVGLIEGVELKETAICSFFVLFYKKSHILYWVIKWLIL